jgi:hypothetical protein
VSNKSLRIFWILPVLLVTSSFSPAQERQGQRVFASVDDEIRYYLTEEDYTLRHYDLLSFDQAAIDRARFLSRDFPKLFIEQSKEYFNQADDRKLYRLIWLYVQISTPDHRPLLILFSPDSFETTFKNANNIRAALVQRLKTSFNQPETIYVVEALGALKQRAAIPEMISFLNSPTNPDVPLNLTVLADLDAKKELATYFQQKVLEEMCIRKDHQVRNGVRTDVVMKHVRAAAQRNDSKYAAYFHALLQTVVWEPDEQALTRYALEGGSERLRGYAALLLSHYQSDAALHTILERLMNDSSNLVRCWAAQSFVNTPDPRAVDTLIAVYDRSDAEIRFCCTEALGVIGGEKAVLTLRRALNDANPQVREMAKFRLAQLAERGH